MVKGSQATDGGNLFIESSIELKNIYKFQENIDNYIRKNLLVVAEFINGKDRWCLWITDQEAEEALKIPFIFERTEQSPEFRI